MSAEIGMQVTAVIGDNYDITTSARQHKIKADEPFNLGGEDNAPDPEELFLSSIASCKLITMRMVAHRKQWNTSGMSMTLTLHREEKRTLIEQTISFPDHLTEEQQEKLRAISHKCPVARMVTGEVVITDGVSE